MKQINIHSFDWHKIFLYGIILFLVSKLFVTCENERTANSVITSLKNQMTTYKLSNGKLVNSVEFLQYEKSQIKKEVPKQIASKFHEIKTLTKTKFVTKFDTIKIEYDKIVDCDFDITGNLATQEYNLQYISNQKGIKITELAIPDSVIVVTGTKRKWLLGKEIKTLDITHSNKFVETESVQHIELFEKKKWYQTTVFKIGLGFLVGSFIVK